MEPSSFTVTGIGSGSWATVTAMFWVPANDDERQVPSVATSQLEVAVPFPSRLMLPCGPFCCPDIAVLDAPASRSTLAPFTVSPVVWKFVTVRTATPSLSDSVVSVHAWPSRVPAFIGGSSCCSTPCMVLAAGFSEPLLSSFTRPFGCRNPVQVVPAAPVAISPTKGEPSPGSSESSTIVTACPPALSFIVTVTNPVLVNSCFCSPCPTAVRSCVTAVFTSTRYRAGPAGAASVHAARALTLTRATSQGRTVMTSSV